MNKSHTGLAVWRDCEDGTPFVELSPCLYFVEVPKSVVVFGAGCHEHRIVEPLVGDDSDMKHIVLLGGVDEGVSKFRCTLFS